MFLRGRCGRFPSRSAYDQCDCCMVEDRTTARMPECRVTLGTERCRQSRSVFGKLRDVAADGGHDFRPSFAEVQDLRPCQGGMLQADLRSL
jgi:hypothetical protein